MRAASLVTASLVTAVLMTGALPPCAHAQGATPPATGAPSEAIRAATLTAGELWFDAKASLGAFRGITRSTKGAIGAAPSLATVRGYVEFLATSLTTDNGLRDKDMRKALEVDKFPTIRFDLDSVAVLDDRRTSGRDSVRIELVGRMSIHGVSRAIRIPAHLRHQTGGTAYHVTGAVDLFVPDYGITRLKRMLGMLSMNETVRLGINVTFGQERESAEARDE